MAIWLGRDGGIRIERAATEPLFADIETGDVDTSSRRFGLSKPVHNLFITGDRLEISRVTHQGNPVGDVLDFIGADGWPDNQQYSDGTWFCNVDSVGGIRLFHTWAEALAGHESAAVSLEDSTLNYRLKIRVLQGNERCLARSRSWTLNTNRNVADITSLGDGFEQNMATMVSGSGDIDCFFDVLPDMCAGDSGSEEFSHYLHRLALRLEIGSTFTGIFIVKHQNARPLLSLNEEVKERELFYRCDCVITEVGIEIDTENEIHSQVSFVTTGDIELLFDYPLNYLLQEDRPDPYKVLQESDFGVLL